MTLDKLLQTYEQSTKDFMTSLRKQWHDKDITDPEQYNKYHGIALGQLQAITDFNVFIDQADKPPITRQQFMDFFRHDDRNEHLTTDDTIEIFIQILKGDSDLSPELFEEVCNEYGTTLDDVLQNKR